MDHQTRGRANRPQELPFTPMHADRFLFASLVIISAQMQHAMHQQGNEFIVQLPPDFNSLTARLRDRDYHIAKHVRREPCGMGRESFPHREGQHVRRSVFLAILSIELAHAVIARQFYAQFRLLFSERTQHQLRHPHQSRPPYDRPFDTNAKIDSHSVRLARGTLRGLSRSGRQLLRRCLNPSLAGRFRAAIIRLDNVLDQPMTNDIPFIEVNEFDAIDSGQNLLHFDETGYPIVRQI
jgi:hypothetical protein